MTKYKKDTELKKEYIQIRVTAEEKKMIEELAKFNRVSVAKFLIELVFNYKDYKETKEKSGTGYGVGILNK